MSDLKPCRSCGAPCKIEPIANEHFTGNIWICSKSARMGGTCDADVHLTRESWQDRPEDRTMQVDGEKLITLINLLADMQEHQTKAQYCLMKATLLLYDLVGAPPNPAVELLRERVPR